MPAFVLRFHSTSRQWKICSGSVKSSSILLCNTANTSFTDIRRLHIQTCDPIELTSTPAHGDRELSPVSSWKVHRFNFCKLRSRHRRHGTFISHIILPSLLNNPSVVCPICRECRHAATIDAQRRLHSVSCVDCARRF